MERYLKNILSFPEDLSQSFRDKVRSFISENNIGKSFIIFSSQTSSSTLKFYVIPIAAMRDHARKFNFIFKADKRSRWLNVLPKCFMGGASIQFRSELAECKEIELPGWNLEQLSKTLFDYYPTHLSLVPTQVYDLVENNISLPNSLKYIFVGGAPMDSTLREKCLQKGFPIYLTYGLTEFCSQVATSKLKKVDQGLTPLSWLDLKTEDETLKIKSPHSFQYKVSISEDSTKSQSVDFLTDEEGFFSTEDRAKIIGDELFILGRKDRLIKSKGLFVDLDQIESKLHSQTDILNSNNSYILSEPDIRKGTATTLFTTIDIRKMTGLVSMEKIKSLGVSKIHYLQDFHYTRSSKIKKSLSSELTGLLNKTIDL